MYFLREQFRFCVGIMWICVKWLEIMHGITRAVEIKLGLVGMCGKVIREIHWCYYDLRSKKLNILNV